MTNAVAVNSWWVGVNGVNDHDSATNSANTELIHILDTIEVPIVVVRRDCTIGCFNKAAADVFDLATADIGRRCRDTAALAALRDLEQQCSEAIARGAESRVDFRNGHRWFVVRISPLQGDRHVTGTVLTFTNVTAFRASHRYAKTTARKARLVADLIRGHKLGEFAPTRLFRGHTNKKEAAKSEAPVGAPAKGGK